MEKKLNNYHKFPNDNNTQNYINDIHNENKNPSISKADINKTNIIQNNINNQNNVQEKINFDENNSNKINKMLTDEEILKCKENGFILIGKTGVGKTSLLNLIFGKTIGKVGHTSKSETKNSNYYCIKENYQGKTVYFCIVDTPGLYDSEGLNADKEQKVEIIKLISNENIKIKSLLFLSNFQNERFDASEQMSLLSYNVLFPLKNFWERIILIFTHYYGDPNGDTKEEIKERANGQISEIFKIIMKKSKKISNNVEYNDIQKLYINIFNKEKNETQKKNNQTIRDNILKTINEQIQLPSMFCKVKILYFEKYEIEKDDKFLYDCNCYIFLDLNDNVVHTEYKILNKYPKNPNLEGNGNIRLNEENFIIDSKGNIQKITKENNAIIDFIKKYKGEGLTCISIISFIAGFIFPPFFIITVPSLIGGVVFLKKKYYDGQQVNDGNNIEMENNINNGYQWD